MKKNKNIKNKKINKAEKPKKAEKQNDAAIKESEALDKSEKKAARAAKKNGGSVAFLVLKIAIAVALVVVVAYFGFACVVREGNSAVILRFGAPRETITEAGLYFKLPWPFEEVYTYDNREQYIESNNLQSVIKDEQTDSTTIILKTYAIWQIDDPLVYHNKVKENGVTTVTNGIQNSLSDARTVVMGMYNLSDLVSSTNENIKTEEIQNEICKLVRANCESNYGIKILDVKILRISYPDSTLQSIFDNISAERQGVINKILTDAQAEASKITSAADAEAEKIIAEGKNKAAEISAQTEKDVAAIYAKAQEENIELFKFLKELDTLVNSVNENSVLVVDSNAYPFNVLLEYSKTVDESTAVIEELEYILEKLPEKDRKALVEAIDKLLLDYKADKQNGAQNAGGT